MTIRLLIGPAVLLVAALLVDDPFGTVILAVLAFGWFESNMKSTRS